MPVSADSGDITAGFITADSGSAVVESMSRTNVVPQTPHIVQEWLLRAPLSATAHDCQSREAILNHKHGQIARIHKHFRAHRAIGIEAE
jgi:hypothetical protein